MQSITSPTTYTLTIAATGAATQVLTYYGNLTTAYTNINAAFATDTVEIGTGFILLHFYRQHPELTAARRMRCSSMGQGHDRGWCGPTAPSP